MENNLETDIQSLTENEISYVLDAPPNKNIKILTYTIEGIDYVNIYNDYGKRLGGRSDSD